MALMDNGLIKNNKEIEIMRGLGKILSKMLDELEIMIKPGLNVWNLELKFLEMCMESNVNPSCKNFKEGGLPPFPTGLCVSINKQSVHCYPKNGVLLSNGDIVNVDTVIDFNGLYVDSARCFPVGSVNDNTKRMLETSKNALYNSILKVRDGVKVGLISHTLQKTVEKEGFNVLKDYAGHGIGHSMHEYPEISCYGSKHEGPKLKKGMTICIESLTCEGSDKVINSSEWETEMADGKNFCIFEHTILITDKGYEILTG